MKLEFKLKRIQLKLEKNSIRRDRDLQYIGKQNLNKQCIRNKVALRRESIHFSLNKTTTIKLDVPQDPITIGYRTTYVLPRLTGNDSPRPRQYLTFYRVSESANLRFYLLTTLKCKNEIDSEYQDIDIYLRVPSMEERTP